ncbi:MAG: radical SAM protein, partial [Acidimicrobiales bacterium]|nr:radical SAM protein [Acidimicrobiales bacterium]
MTTHSVVQDEDQFCVYRSVESQGTRVLWELTSACNLKCDFCLVEIKGRHLPVEDGLAIADELVAARVDKVLLSGGEPLLYPGIEAVMRRLAGAGVLVKLLTNGTIDHPGVFALIRASDSIEVSLSLPTVDPFEADLIFKRPGTLAKITATIDALPKSRLNVICAVSTLNAGAVESVVDWVAASGVACLSLTGIFKDPNSPARFRDDCRDLRIDDAQREQLFALVAAKREQYRGHLAIRTTQFVVQPQEVCMAGRTVFYIDPMGVVSPCTVTDNTIWHEVVKDMTVGEAIDFYRSTLDDAPPS